MNSNRGVGLENFEDLSVDERLPAGNRINETIELVREEYRALGITTATEEREKYLDKFRSLIRESLVLGLDASFDSDAKTPISGETYRSIEAKFAHLESKEKVFAVQNEIAAMLPDKEGTLNKLGLFILENWEVYYLIPVWRLLCIVGKLMESPKAIFSPNSKLKILTGLNLDRESNLVAALAIYSVALQRWQYYLETKNMFTQPRSVSELGSMSAAQNWGARKAIVSNKAQELWALDGDNPRTITAMVEFLFDELSENPEEFLDMKPPAKTTVRKWVKTVAAPEVSRPGRPRTEK